MEIRSMCTEIVETLVKWGVDDKYYAKGQEEGHCADSLVIPF